MAHEQQLSIAYLLILSCLAAAGRVAGALILYALAGQLEAALLNKNRSILGISHSSITATSKYVNASKHAGIILFLMNALPIFPTAALSVTCGFIKVPLRMFIISTTLGSAVNAFLYMLAAYAGWQTIQQAENLESATQLLIVVLLIAAGVWLIRRRRSR
jgi:membrane protein DedA with SNARE-associated domain